MKLIFSLILIVIFSEILHAQQPYYYYKGNKIELEYNSDKIFVKFNEGVSENEIIEIISSYNALKLNNKESLAFPNNTFIIDVNDNLSIYEVKEIIANLNKNNGIAIANHFITYPVDNTLQGITDEFIVKLKFSSDFEVLQKLASEQRVVILKQNEFEPSIYTLVADKYSLGNALDMANFFHQSGKFEFSEPVFIRILKSQCVNDLAFNQQWGLQNTGQHSGVSGVDIKACQAWDITRGRNEVSVAIIDEGVDLSHPDLINNLLPGYDATGQGSSGGPQGNDAHGTACAGIVAAQSNNSEGISGVAPNCKIIPIRIAYKYNGNWVTNDTWISNGINWAWQNQADVLSNSWNGGTPSAQVENAIANAVTNGRGGLGSPVLFAAGNEDSFIPWPSNLSTVISVGAISMCGTRKQQNSCDGETNWGSNYGNELSVMAPGVKIYTSDISGNSGYTSGDYTSEFNGTSSACPHAAGVMALILSVNRCLTLSEAKNILELSCDKIGPYCYNFSSSHPNGTWNNEMGYGKINAYNAVRFAFSSSTNSYSNISGNDLGPTNCNGNLCGWVLSSGGCSGLAAATYFGYRHRIEANVNFPYTPGALIIGTSNGFSLSNPDNGNYYMGSTNISSTGATLFTYVFETYNILGQFLGWVPNSPQNIRFNYSVLSILDQDIYLQNQTVSTGVELHNAMNKIETGRNVTNAVPVGDYIVTGNADVTLHAGNIVLIQPGTYINPGPNGNFRAYVEPFFTCTQFPNGKISNDNFPSIVNSYDVTRKELNLSNSDEVEKPKLKIYPNPSYDNVNIEYYITKSGFVEVTLHDICGKPLYNLQSKSKHQPGTYHINLTGINLPSGTYNCVIKTESYIETCKLLIIK